MKSEITKLLKWRKGVTEEEPLKDYWRTLTDLITSNEEQGYEIMREATDDEVYYLSEIFEDISERLKSEKFISLLNELKVKFPETVKDDDIDLAIAAMKKK